jgi:hypothetical protein
MIKQTLPGGTALDRYQRDGRRRPGAAISRDRPREPQEVSSVRLQRHVLGD